MKVTKVYVQTNSPFAEKISEWLIIKKIDILTFSEKEDNALKVIDGLVIFNESKWLSKEIEEMECMAKNNQKPTLNIDINGTLMVAVSNLDLWVERNRCKKIMIIGSNDLLKNPNLDRFLQLSNR
jgi:methylaspartate ammonia-lyase